MTRQDLIAIVPLFILTSASILVLFSIAVRRNHKMIYAITTLSLLADFIYIAVAGMPDRVVEPLFIFDGFGRFNLGLILLTAVMLTMLSFMYFEQREERKEEYYILLILATLGACVLAISKHFVSLFLGLEILSVSLYSMIAYLRKRERSDEGGIKYLIIAAFSSAFMLFGMALIYYTTGTMEFGATGRWLNGQSEVPLVMIGGLGFVIVGVGFKLGLVPFHMWTADVYEGAPLPVTSFIATVSKGGVVALLVRFYSLVGGQQYESIVTVFTVLAVASMFAGNFLALQQDNLKRLLAYSSISHLGYILVALLAGGSLGVEAVSFYLVAYFITTVGSFGILTNLSDRARDADHIDDFRGLFWRRPWTAVGFCAMLLSLAGIPLTAGFVGKFFVVAAGVQVNSWTLVTALVVNSAIGLYYYIRILAVMTEKTERNEHAQPAPQAPAFLLGGLSVALLTLGLLWLGVLPEGLMGLIRTILNAQ
jgi:NADH-quinone oxidoreductase subunit N